VSLAATRFRILCPVKAVCPCHLSALFPIISFPSPSFFSPPRGLLSHATETLPNLSVLLFTSGRPRAIPALSNTALSWLGNNLRPSSWRFSPPSRPTPATREVDNPPLVVPTLSWLGGDLHPSCILRTVLPASSPPSRPTPAARRHKACEAALDG
jgi:hypothetical protein